MCFQLRKCFYRHSCYPGGKRWIFYLVPGFICAGTGLIVFACFETHVNYHYTHSSWHALMAFSILFILPPKQQKGKGANDNLVEEIPSVLSDPTTKQLLLSA